MTDTPIRYPCFMDQNGNLRSYQRDLVRSALGELQNGRDAVIGAATGAGKTFMAFAVLARLASGKFTAAWAAHGLSSLRDQAYSEACRYPGLADWTIHKLDPREPKTRPGNPNKVLIILLPNKEHLSKKPLPDLDALVIDEAHERFLKKKDAKDDLVVQKIIKTQRQKPRLLLLSATPFCFTDLDQFKTFYYPLGRLYQEGQAAPMNWDVAVTAWEKRIEEYLNDQGVIREDADLPKKFQQDALLEVLRKLAYRLKEDIIEAQEFADPTTWQKFKKMSMKGLKKLFGESGSIPKTLFVAYSVKSAQWLEKNLKAVGIRAVVSEHKSDPDSLNVEAFRINPRIDALVVVDRCTLGWNFPALRYVVDFSFTRSIPRIIQTVGRLTRPYEGPDGEVDPGKKKVYIKACSAAGVRVDRAYCNATVHVMMDEERFSSFTGKLEIDQKIHEPRPQKPCSVCGGLGLDCRCPCQKCGNLKRECTCIKKKAKPQEIDPEEFSGIWSLDEKTPQYFQYMKTTAADNVQIFATTTLRKEMIAAGTWGGGDPESAKAEILAYVKAFVAAEKKPGFDAEEFKKNWKWEAA